MGKTGKLLLAGGAAFGLVWLLRRQAGAGEVNSQVQALIADPIYFEFDSVRVDAEGAERLKALVLALAPLQWSRIVITGHADSSGGQAYNYDLAMRRAAAAKTFLQQNELRVPSGASVHTRSHGSTRPVASNDSPAGRALNRRVEIAIAP